MNVVVWLGVSKIQECWLLSVVRRTGVVRGVVPYNWSTPVASSHKYTNTLHRTNQEGSEESRLVGELLTI